ncbi:MULTISPECIES: AAA family ATPase [Psychrobacter]|uniref:ATPase n=1 Tax=Psychrobacter alimentarius TaxID=261164 RepID=A0ABM5ZYT3_9GAMM|nr:MULTISPECIES: AAA family ATPase [Psychrobacter]AMT97248.1 ATPase [Psychrobacter alimentarius]
MSNNLNVTETQSYWFVGSIYNDQDHTERFIEDGVWEFNSEAKPIDSIKSIKAGDRIAIKSAYTRKNALPFDNRGHSVSVMLIKAIGTVVENLGDGKNLKVEWEADSALREWYFFTSRNTVWKVIPETALRAGLIDFTFHGKAQDIDMFRNDPYWRERFGDNTKENSSFKWTSFYEEMASKLLTFRDRRDELITGIHRISEKSDVMSILNDQYEEGVEGGLLKDICPFTVMALFNRKITDENRKFIARELAKLLNVSEPVPDSFDGIPLVNNQKTWFFGYGYKRQPNDIDILWDVFAQAISFTDLGNESESEKIRSEFIAVYDKAVQCHGVGWNLTMGLYWIRPWNFLTLDGQSQEYINKKLNIEISMNGPKGRCNANDYLELMANLDIRFKEDSYPVHSFPALSYAAYKYQPDDSEKLSNMTWKDIVLSQVKQLCHDKQSNEFTVEEFLERFTNDLEERFPNRSDVEGTIKYLLREMVRDEKIELLSKGVYKLLDEALVSDSSVETYSKFDTQVIPDTYSIDDITADGCFLPQPKIEMILKRLQAKKNIILQGPPGTGKTWLAKRLAFALIGHRDDSKIRAVQFHPNLSYEDFIRGWRPSGEGKLTLVDGPFMEMIKVAIEDPESKYVIVIEEINRGNPAQVFGEMLTLLETDKRTPNEALELSYKKEDGERVFIPDNLYVVGTMNIADRSLALVDLALRRRFAFIDLEPTLGKAWRNWVQDKNGIDADFLYHIERRINVLNDEISTDASLGAQFQVGHSYVTPAFGMNITDAKEWFSEVVETEIGPLLDEYWFDNLDKSQSAQKRLIAGL